MSFPQKKYLPKVSVVKKTNGKNGKTVSVHHRKPRSIGGTEEARNKIELPINHHRAWHRLFQNWTAERIAQEITELYLDPDYEMIAVKKKK
jgi:hypothetical protein